MARPAAGTARRRSRAQGPQSRQQLWVALGIPADYARMRCLPVQREAKQLSTVGRNADGRPVRLAPAAAAAWRRMREAAERDGVHLRLVSGFRSVTRQARIIRRKLAAGGRIGDILRFVAAPGCSEHQTGRALDLGSPAGADLDENFARTREYRWLCRRAGEFGFRLSYARRNPHGIGFEPWHWCWHRGRR